MAAVERVPFGELSSGRLQQLASAKNRQSGLVAQQDACKPSMPTAPTKRSFAMSTLNEDSENVDPVLMSSSKKNKFDLFATPTKPLTFVKPAITTAPRLLGIMDTLPPRSPLSAPAGRSPKRKTIGLAKPRRFARVDPPSFAMRSDALPFSLDAALNSTLSNAKSVPAKWKFDIHVDTPEEEAGILMEHSTLTLDLSSDDESVSRDKLDRGKENVAPEDYTTPLLPNRAGERTASVIKLDIVRKKIETDDMDDGQRSPLSDLEVEPFNTLSEGEEKFITVDAENAQSGTDFTFTLAATADKKEQDITPPSMETSLVKDDVVIAIYEDDSTSSSDATPTTNDTIIA